MPMPMTARIRVLGLFALSCLAALRGMGQSSDGPHVAIEPRARPGPAPEIVRPATFRLDVKLIQIPITITDSRNRPVLGLERDRFRVFEDDIEQQIAAFSMTDGAVSVGLVFDSSGSMRTHIADSRKAIDEFLKTSVQGDQYFLVQFSDSPSLRVPLTPDPGEIARKLGFIQPHGWTAMNDAIVRALGELRRASNPRRVLLVLTDGADNNSRYSDGELLSLVREADAVVFAIGLFERPRFLERLAEETGGKVIWVRHMNDLPEAIAKLSLEIRNQYLVGYFSDRVRNDGRYHKVRIDVQQPSEKSALRVNWRKGYVAP